MARNITMELTEEQALDLVRLLARAPKSGTVKQTLTELLVAYGREYAAIANREGGLSAEAADDLYAGYKEVL